MTRINCIPVEDLHRQHLIAEYRELPRIFKQAKDVKDAPKEYVLGTGHIKFFYDKLGYLVKRQKALIAEMQRRGYNPTFTDTSELETCAPEHLYNDWVPDEKAIALNLERINLRLKGMKA